MNPTDRHPIDDSTEPGTMNTLGALHEACEVYREKRDKVIAAETTLKAAQEALTMAQLEMRYSKEVLTRVIEDAAAQVEASKERERFLAAPIEVPLPPDVKFEDATPEQDPASSAPRPRDFDANDTSYDQPPPSSGPAF